METTTKAAPTKRRARATVAVERELLVQVLGINDKLHSMQIAIERSSNAIESYQALVMRDLERHAGRLNNIEMWRQEIDAERNEQRGAAKLRRSLLTGFTAIGAVVGGLVGTLVGWLIRHG